MDFNYTESSMTTPRLSTVELHITYECNLRCKNCSSLCGLAPAKEGMDLSTDSFMYFLQDTISNNYKWKKIKLFGGEPTLHQHIEPFCRLLKEYVDSYNESCIIRLVSNGSDMNMAYRLQDEFGVELGIERKLDNLQSDYVTVNDSPTDAGEDTFLGCYISEDCGVAYNYLGYYECSPAAAAARVFGYDPVALSVRDLTVESCIKAYESHCKHCGFSRAICQRSSKQITSRTWNEKFQAYTER